VPIGVGEAFKVVEDFVFSFGRIIKGVQVSSLT
jgi:hypothetical protein